MKKFIKISEAAKKLNLVNKKTKKPLNYVLRYWEKEFKQIRPRKLNNQRYYTLAQIEIIKNIKFLLKNKGMTITGVRNLLNSNINKLDYDKSDSLKAEYYKNNIKTKTSLLLEKIKKIKNYGKKNTS